MSHTDLFALLNAVAFSYGLTAADILGPSRNRRQCQARRSAAIQMAARGMSFAAIGRALGRHHTTVLHLVGHRPARVPRYVAEASL